MNVYIIFNRAVSIRILYYDYIVNFVNFFKLKNINSHIILLRHGSKVVYQKEFKNIENFYIYKQSDFYKNIEINCKLFFVTEILDNYVKVFQYFLKNWDKNNIYFINTEQLSI